MISPASAMPAPPSCAAGALDLALGHEAEDDREHRDDERADRDEPDDAEDQRRRSPGPASAAAGCHCGYCCCCHGGGCCSRRAAAATAAARPGRPAAMPDGHCGGSCAWRCHCGFGFSSPGRLIVARTLPDRLAFRDDGLEPRRARGAHHRRRVRHRRRARAPARRPRHAHRPDRHRRRAARTAIVAGRRDRGRRRARRRGADGRRSTTSPRRLGGIDVAVANAGIATGGPLRHGRAGDRRGDDRRQPARRLAHRPRGAAARARAPRPPAADRLRGGRPARPPGLGAYSASKAGVEALGRSLRVELKPHGVTRRRRLLPVPGDADGRGGRALAGLRATRKSRLPSPLAKTWPLEPAIARTVTSIEKRSRAVAHPPFLRGLMALRGLLDNAADRPRDGRRRCRAMEEAFAAEAERIGAGGAPRARRGRPLIGSVVAGHRIVRLVGRGGMGVVYEAVEEALGRTVALKLVAPERAGEPGFRERFIAESRLAASIDHPERPAGVQGGRGGRAAVPRDAVRRRRRPARRSAPLEPARAAHDRRPGRRRARRRARAPARAPRRQARQRPDRAATTTPT